MLVKSIMDGRMALEPGGIRMGQRTIVANGKLGSHSCRWRMKRTCNYYRKIRRARKTEQKRKWYIRFIKISQLPFFKYRQQVVEIGTGMAFESFDSYSTH